MRGAGGGRSKASQFSAGAVAVALLALTVVAISQEVAPPEEPVPAPENIPQLPRIPIFRAPQFVPGAGADAERPQLFVTDRTASRRLSLAESRLERRIYDEAVDLLQLILDADEDTSSPPDNDESVFRSLKGQANDLLARLPPEGRRVYELKYGVAAQARLKEAVEGADWDGVEDVSRRYFHTSAGQEATYRLAVWLDDRGESFEAALLLQRLARGEQSPYEPQLSLRTAVSWAKAGIDDLAHEAAARYLKLAEGRAVPPDSALPTAKSQDQLMSWLASVAGPKAQSPWPELGGGPRRIVDAEPVSIGTAAAWTHPLHEATRWDDAQESATAWRLSRGLELMTAYAKGHGELTQPAFHPVVADNTVIFRTLRNIQAVDLVTGEFRWQTERPHDRFFDQAVAQIGMLIPFGSDADSGGLIDLGRPIAQLAWQNLTAGTLSTDGRFVYGIEGTGRAGNSRKTIVQGANGPMVVGEENFNTLYAYELAADGRIAWTAGGPRGRDALSGLFFLGPPLPLGGQLYALAEREGTVELVVMNPRAVPSQRLVWSQTLVQSDRSLSSDPLRRLSGLSPAFADGVLVCPTGAGAVVAVDLARRILLWGYQYPTGVEMPAGDPAAPIFLGLPQANALSSDIRQRWLDAVPRIVGDAVFLTPRDSAELHCLDLKSGKVRWKHPRETLLYLATVHDGLAVLVGRMSIIALDIATGQEVWKQPLRDMPAGRGVQCGDLYHLPLASGEIATFRLSNHQELARTPIGSNLTPGNLIAVDGRLISQSTESIAGFPPSEELEAALQREAGTAPSAALLAARGTRELHRGNIEAGLEHLRQSLRISESPAVKRQYVQVLLEGLRSDFAHYRKHEHDLFSKIDDSVQQAEFLRLFAEGLKAADEIEAALSTYVRLALCDGAASGFTRTEDGGLVRNDRLDRVRIEELLAQAEPAQRAQMKDLIADEVTRVANAGDVAALERLVAMFGDAANDAASTSLARLYEARGDRLKLERALIASLQRHLGSPVSPSLRQPLRNVIAARAIYETPSFDSAFHAEYLPDEIKSGRTTTVEPSFPMRVVGDAPVEYQSWRFDLADDAQSLVARDGEGHERWRIPLQPPGRERGNVSGFGRAQVRFSGHLLAVAVGTRFVMLDLLSDEPRPPALWYNDLIDRRYGEMQIDRRSMSNSMDGPIGFAGAGVLVSQAGSIVTAADPLTGNVFWRRADLPLNCEISGDAEFVTLQLPGGSGGVLVLDAVDGKTVGKHDLPASSVRVGCSGTNVVLWDRSETGMNLVCHDVARNTPRWSNRFSNSALVAMAGPGDVAVMDAVEGRIALFSLDDGKQLLEGNIEPDPNVADFAATRHLGHLIVFTRQGAGRRAVDVYQPLFLCDGAAYGFVEDGRRLWTTVLEPHHVLLEQAKDLPLIVLTAERNSLAGEARFHASLLDIRNGALLIEKGRQVGFQPFESKTDESGSIVVATKDARFLLTPTREPLAKRGSKDKTDPSSAVRAPVVIGQP